MAETLTSKSLQSNSLDSADIKGVYASLKDLVRLQYQARGFSFLPRQPLGSTLIGRHASRLRGRGLNFEELRHYRTGDDIRQMDWKVTNRTRKPHVRVFTEERERRTIIAVDQRISMFFGSQQSMKSVVAAELAALAAWRVLSVGDCIGGWVFADGEHREIRPQRSQKQVLNLLQSLVNFNQRLQLGLQSNQQQLNHILQQLVIAGGHDQLFIVITDMSGADDLTEKLLSQLSRHNDVLVALVYDVLETELPLAGCLTVSDGDALLEVNTNQEKLRRDYAQRFADRLERARHFLKRRGIPVLPVHTGGDVPGQVRTLLNHVERSPRLL